MREFLTALILLAPACGGGGGSSTIDASGGGACAPTASCTAPDKACIGLVDNAGKTSFGLRISELDLTKPVAFTGGLIAHTIGGAANPAVSSCNLDGSATLSWLLRFDTTASTLETGGARPVADPTQGYSFDDEQLQSFHVQPVTFSGVAPDAGGNFAVTSGSDLILPVFLSADGSSYLLLPLKQARLRMGTLSSSHNCIGSYNADGLDPANSCQPDATHPLFIDGGSLDAHLTLEDADTVTVTLLQESLCVLLSGDAATYGDGAQPVQHCKRTNGIIDFKGDWCDATNSPADANCFDSEQLTGNFAASSVKIN